MPDLLWARPFRRRCASRLSKVDSPTFFGRCELERDHMTAHALERGMFILQWSVHYEARPTAVLITGHTPPLGKSNPWAS